MTKEEFEWSGLYEKVRWEYHIVDVGLHNSVTDLRDILDAVGKEGWELVVVIAESVFIFKRRVE